MTKLYGKFTTQDLMSTFGVVQPLYCIQLEPKVEFIVHLAILKVVFC
jgi:hypothetical protein